MNVNLRQLQAFVAVYRLGSITQAAEKLSITQPAVSVLVRQLEQSTGVKLFDRTTRSLRATSAAHDSVAKAERILNDFYQLVAGFKDVAAGRSGSVRVGSTPAVAAAFLSPAMVEFCKRFPGVDIAVHDLAPTELVTSVVEDEVEFSIGTPDGESFDVDLSTLVQDQMCVVCLNTSPLARRKAIAWREVTGCRTVTVRRGHGIRTLIDDTLGRLGVRFEPTWEVSYLSTAMSLTRHGLGISILPSYLVRYLAKRQLAAIQLIDPIVTRNLSIVTRRGASLSPAAINLVEVLRSQVCSGGSAPTAQ